MYAIAREWGLSGTNIGQNWPYGHRILPNGEEIWSGNLEYKLMLPSDGNLALDQSGRAQVWRAGVKIPNPGYAILAPDGELAIFDATGKQVWSNGVHVDPGSLKPGGMLLQNDGNLVLYKRDGSVPWASQPGKSQGTIFQQAGRAISSVANTAETIASFTNPAALIAREIPDLLAKVPIPALNQLAHYIPSMPDPSKLAANLAAAAVSGDVQAIEHQVLSVGHQVADTLSMVPGVGNAIGGPLAAALELLETGSALKAALELLLGQIPGIPPTVRDILRPILDGIADVVERGAAVDDALLASFKQGAIDQAKRSGVPDAVAGLVSDLIDSAIQIILRHKPLGQSALDLARKGLETAASKALSGVSLPNVPLPLADIGKLKMPTGGLPSLPIPDSIRRQVEALVPAAVRNTLNSGELRQVVENTVRRQLPAAFQQAEQSFSDLQSTYNRANALQSLTQNIVKLSKQDPLKRDPAIQKQIQDLKTAVRAQSANTQGHAKVVTLRRLARPTVISASAPKAVRPVLQTIRTPPSVPAAPAALVAPLKPVYGPYPGRVPATPGVVSEPPHGHHGGGHGHGRGGGGHDRQLWGGWPWAVPWTPEPSPVTETCRTWSEPIAEVPAPMDQAARIALAASGGRPTTTLGPDNVFYLFAYESGALTVRACVATARA